MRDAEQPCPEVAARAKQLQSRKSPQERFLHHVFGRMRVVRHVVQPAIQPVPVAFDKDSERVPVAHLGSVDQHMLLAEELRIFPRRQAKSPSWAQSRGTQYKLHLSDCIARLVTTPANLVGERSKDEDIPQSVSLAHRSAPNRGC